MAQKDKLSDKKLAKKIMESAQEIWLAGLSAFEKAEKEGNKLFESLVEEGRSVEARTRKVAGATFDEIKGKATSNWDNLEQIFENRVSTTLQRLGVPSKRDIDALTQRVEALDASVTALLAAKQSKAQPVSASDTKDNLQKVKGIGEVIENRLHQLGIITFRQIASWNDADIERIENAINTPRFSCRIRQNNWIEQAKEQHFLKYDEKL